MVLAIIQARMGSSRLPNKVLMNFADKPNLMHIYERLKKSKLIDKIIIATSVNRNDDAIEEFCKINNYSYFRGSEGDVLSRFYECAKKYETDCIVRITGDCPLVDPNVVDNIIQTYLENKRSFDYVSNVNPPTFPDGLDVEVFSSKALTEAYKNSKLSSEREHVTPYIRNNSRTCNVESEIDYSDLRFTLDEKKDYYFIDAIYNNLYNENNIFVLDDILDYLKRNPKLLELNSNIMRNEGYKRSLASDKLL